jgi:hypothetical protein
MRQKIQQADTGLWKPLRKPLPEELLCAQIQNAVLCLHDYLRNNAVIPSNDATLAFIDSQIQGEKERARVGQSENRLERLQKYRAQYEQSLGLLQGAISQDQLYQEVDMQIVQLEIDGLCRSKHFGDDMQRILKENTKTATVYQEEIPVDLGPGNQWGKWHIT